MAGRLGQSQRPCRVLVSVQLSLSRQRDRSGESVQRQRMTLALCYINRLGFRSQAQSGPPLPKTGEPMSPSMLDVDVGPNTMKLGCLIQTQVNVQVFSLAEHGSLVRQAGSVRSRNECSISEAINNLDSFLALDRGQRAATPVLLTQLFRPRAVDDESPNYP